MPTAVWAPKAESDLEDILYYIRAVGERPLVAKQIGEEIAAAAEHQASLPIAGSRHFAAPPEWRYFQHKRWLIFFQPHSLGIEILRVIDGARDLPRVLAEPPTPE
ncbi:MAG: type II toxin-antitoxin system RelE/ParE family toxin [Pirellulales bacterium]